MIIYTLLRRSRLCAALVLFLLLTISLNAYAQSASIPTYTVTFVESGLPPGTEWGVTIVSTSFPFSMTNTSTTNTITFNVPPGTYSYAVSVLASGYSATPSNGTVTVNSNISIQITFTQVTSTTYTVAFIESGLPAGTYWSVTFNGITKSSTGNTITFNNIQPGTYKYTVGSVSGYTASPSSGTVTVNGNTNVQITFIPVTYTVTFIETGLPSGTQWGVTFNGIGKSSTSNTITFNNVPPGAYQYTVNSPQGYSASPSGGTVNVNGNVNIQITFMQIMQPVSNQSSQQPNTQQSSQSSSSSSQSQPSHPLPDLVTIGAVLLFGAMGGSYAWFRHRSSRGGKELPKPPKPGSMGEEETRVYGEGTRVYVEDGTKVYAKEELSVEPFEEPSEEKEERTRVYSTEGKKENEKNEKH